MKRNSYCFVLATILILKLINGDSNCLNEHQQTDELIVETIYGKISGLNNCDVFGNRIEAYLGIPFAKPPVGQLRYKYPEPPEKWEGILQTKNYSNSCEQFVLKFLTSVPGSDRLLPFTPLSEDCLYLNVWTPKANTSSKVPVMVFVHGGAFSIGSTAALLYDPTHLVAGEDVVFVTMNYRLSSFGFIHFNHPEIDSNVGLMDQVEALKWVRDNIDAFGGDPQRVTLFGQSAGAMSAGFHLLSPYSKDLFQRIILESGTPFSDWATKSKESMEKVSKQLIENIGCAHENVNETIKCLKDADAKEIIASEPRLDYDLVVFYPIVDGKFLLERPNDILVKKEFKKVDIILGLTANEGAAILSLTDPFLFNPVAKEVHPVQEDKKHFIKKLLPFDSKIVTDATIAQYSNSNTSSAQILDDLTTAASDYLFTCPANRVAQKYAETDSKVYGFFFTHRSKNSVFAKWLGVLHGEELHYVFGYVFGEKSSFNEEDKKLSKRVMRYWANFARTGDPNKSPENEIDEEIELAEWPPYTLQDKQYFIMHPNSTKVIQNFKEGDCKFWDKMLPYLRSIKKN